MGRSVGFVVFVLLVVAAAGLRCHEGRRADALLASEARAREQLARLYEASADAVRTGARHPGLRGAFLEAAPGVEPLDDIGSEEVSYAADDDYLYGLATRTLPGSRNGSARQGFILRAWPRDYGASGDLEFQISDDGELWQGQNLLGRSGTSVGFPPAFPDPGVGDPDEPWWIVPLPDHR